MSRMNKIFLGAACLLVPAQAPAQEDAYNAAFCSSLDGENCVTHEGKTWQYLKKSQ